jgi:hypothetical protein
LASTIDEIFGEKVRFKGAGKIFLSTPLSDALPFAALPAFGSNGEISPHSGRNDDQARWTIAARFPLPAPPHEI